VSITDLGIGSPYKDTYGPTTISVAVNLLDVASGQAGVLTFTGSLSGYVNSNGTTQQSHFANPWAATSLSETLGGVKYTVSIDPTTAFVAPGPPPSGGTGLTGGYSFHVTAAPVPEPGSVSLALLGIGSLGAIGLVRRRRSRA